MVPVPRPFVPVIRPLLTDSSQRCVSGRFRSVPLWVYLTPSLFEVYFGIEMFTDEQTSAMVFKVAVDKVKIHFFFLCDIFLIPLKPRKTRSRQIPNTNKNVQLSHTQRKPYSISLLWGSRWIHENLRLVREGSCAQMRAPNANPFALWWNIGLRIENSRRGTIHVLWDISRTVIVRA